MQNKPLKIAKNAKFKNTCQKIGTDVHFKIKCNYEIKNEPIIIFEDLLPLKKYDFLLIFFFK